MMCAECSSCSLSTAVDRGCGGVFVREGRRSRVNSIVGGTRRLLGSVPGHSWIQLFCHVEVVDYAGAS